MVGRLDDERLKDEVTHYVLQCVLRHEECARELKKELHGHRVPSASLLRDAVLASVRLMIVDKHLPTAKVMLARMKPREMRRMMVAALEFCSTRLMDQACGADNSGAMNSTDAMHRTVATIEMAQMAQFVREWTTKL